MENSVFIRPVIKLLDKIKGNDLYISGQCLLSPLRFGQFFFEKNNTFHRPIFLLKPYNTSDKFFLVMDGPIIDLCGSNFISCDGKTVSFHNTAPLMYIFMLEDFSKASQKDILRGYEFQKGIFDPAIKKENGLCEKVLEIGFIQPSVVSAIFTATFDHENSKAGRFTLLLE